MNTNNIVMWVILLNNADWDCLKTLTLPEILKIQKSTSGGTLCVFGSHTFVPISWMCKKQTSVSHSSTESEITSLDTGLRYYSHIHDEVTVYDAFPATILKLDEDGNLPEDTTAQDDQEDETEQSLSETLQTRRQISKIHENMGHPSNRTLIRVSRLGGAKNRFILAAAKHSCGACEAQKRPAGPMVSSFTQFPRVH